MKDKRDAVEAAAELAHQNLLAARERRTWEVVEHGHRAFIEADKAGVFSIHLYRCGREDEGAIRYRTNLGDLEVARAAALELCEVESQKAPQLDLFG
mgnify:FL=1